MIIILYVFGLIAFCSGVSLPSHFERCRVAEDLDFKSNECLKNSITNALKDLKNGNAMLEVPSIDPLKIEKMKLEQGSSSSPVSIQLQFKNLDMNGISTTKITNVTGKLSTLNAWNMNLEGHLDKFQLIGDYDINGNVLILPIVGRGKCNITFVKPKINVKIFGERKVKNGVDYLKLVKYEFDENIERIFFNFENLFNGNSLLGSTTNTFFNENWHPIYTELRPPVDKAIGQVVEKYAKKILEKVPFKEIFLID